MRSNAAEAGRTLPNKRLKLAGADRSKGSGVLCPGGHGLRPPPLRRRASRPQLKRDPLGGALPPHKHPFVNSFGTVSARGAERRGARGRICSPRPTTPTARHRPAAPRTSFHWVAAQSQLPNPRRARAPSCARRVRASVQSAPSNMRLELAAPCGRGRIPFVTHQARRRSSSAIR